MRLRVTLLSCLGIIVPYGFLVLSARIGYGGDASEAQAVVRIKRELLTMEEVVGTIRDQTGNEIYVDRPWATKPVYVSPGTYTAADLIAACCQAWRLSPRSVGTVSLLTPWPEGTQEARQKAFRSQLRALLGWLVERFDFQFAQVPFTASDFLTEASFTWADLSPEQRRFLSFYLESRHITPQPDLQVSCRCAFDCLLVGLEHRAPPPISPEEEDRLGGPEKVARLRQSMEQEYARTYFPGTIVHIARLE